MCESKRFDYIFDILKFDLNKFKTAKSSLNELPKCLYVNGDKDADKLWRNF